MKYFRTNDINHVDFEDGFPSETIATLRSMGHDIGVLSGHQRAKFGRGQVITRGTWWSKTVDGEISKQSNVYWAGSDPRADGIVATY